MINKVIAGIKYTAWGIAAVSLLWFLLALIRLKSPIGVHFDGNGQFDVIDSKFYGFYPHAINALCIGITALADFLTDKIRTGLKVSEYGESLLKTTVHLCWGWGRLLIVLFFAYWNALVILQIPLSVCVPNAILTLLFIGLLATITAIIIIRYAIGKKEIPYA